MNDWFVWTETEDGETDLFGPYTAGQALAIEEDIVSNDPAGNTRVWLSQPREYTQ